MHLSVTIRTLGLILIFISISLIAPIIVALYYGENYFLFIKVMAVGIITGGLFYFIPKIKMQEIGIRDGFIIVTFGWLFAGILGSLPFILYNSFGPLSTESIINSLFESLSGFTTTGATVIQDVEILPKSLLFWRSLTHWLGGMGIICLSIAILPLLGVGGMQLFKAEVPGPVAEKIKPRISETAVILWYVYVFISAIQVILLLFGEMNLFEALCHTFGTMATGGFSTRNSSITAYTSPYIQWVIIIFMILAGINFSLHYSALTGNLKSYIKNTECKVFIITLIFIIFISSLIYHFSYNSNSFEESIRTVAFQVTSIITTTGYITSDYEKWPYVLQIIILVLMFLGGCTGSTGGSIKFMRYIIMVKHTFIEIIKQIHPKIILSLKYNDSPIQDSIVKAVWAFFFAFLSIFVISTLVMSFIGLDLQSAIGSSIACLANVGPGFGIVGPTSNYAAIPPLGKAFLSILMIIGRLEIFTVIIIFFPAFWKD